MKPGSLSKTSHLVACSIAVGIACIALLTGKMWCQRLEERYIHALAPEFTPEKLQGVALQKNAFNQPDLLVLYGSSELAKEMPNNAIQFFSDYPTGFRVFPVGKPGTASLAVLQKVAAMGKEIKGRKVAYSISPGFFFTEIFDPAYYEGSFSELQASEFAFSGSLSSELKRDVARRMLSFPKTLEDKPLLDFALTRLAGDSILDHLLYAAAWPLGRLHNAVGRMQDHAEAALHILEVDEKLNPEPKRGLRAMNWNEVLKATAKFANGAAVQAKKNEVKKRHTVRASRDKTFMQTMGIAREWTDVELLMRTFKELGAEPLLLSMPVEDIRLELYGITPNTRDAYVERMGHLASRYQIPLAAFRDHETDNGFLVDFLDHLSAEGWLYYNKVLDDFFHDRLSKF